MSNPEQPKQDWPSPDGEQGQDEMKDALMERGQELEHVQSRFSNLQMPGQPSSQPSGPPPAQPEERPVASKTATGTVSVHQPLREKVGTLLPSTEGGVWRVASVLRLGSAGFGLMTAVLIALPELSGRFQTPTTESLIQPTYNTIAPVLDKPPAPSADPEKPITEQTASFDGAAILMVESEPGNASVRVDGADQGNTPVSLTLDCLPGKPIKVEVSRRGYERAQHVTFCRMNTMIKLYARMRKLEKPASASGGTK